jgi:CheY-like chemotaxis protein
VELTLDALTEYKLANEIQVARDGVEALDYLLRRGAFAERPPGHPVVVLLDLKMPRVDGIEVLRQMRSDEDLRLVPVVVLTSSAESRDMEECYHIGINAYVVKPVRFTAFIEAVKHIGVFWALINQPPPRSRRSGGCATTPTPRCTPRSWRRSAEPPRPPRRPDAAAPTIRRSLAGARHGRFPAFLQGAGFAAARPPGQSQGPSSRANTGAVP